MSLGTTRTYDVALDEGVVCRKESNCHDRKICDRYWEWKWLNESGHWPWPRGSSGNHVLQTNEGRSAGGGGMLLKSRGAGQSETEGPPLTRPRMHLPSLRGWSAVSTGLTDKHTHTPTPGHLMYSHICELSEAACASANRRQLRDSAVDHQDHPEPSMAHRDIAICPNPHDLINPRVETLRWSSR